MLCSKFIKIFLKVSDSVQKLHTVVIDLNFDTHMKSEFSGLYHSSWTMKPVLFRNRYRLNDSFLLTVKWLLSGDKWCSPDNILKLLLMPVIEMALFHVLVFFMVVNLSVMNWERFCDYFLYVFFNFLVCVHTKKLPLYCCLHRPRRVGY